MRSLRNHSVCSLFWSEFNKPFSYSILRCMNDSCVQVRKMMGRGALEALSWIKEKSECKKRSISQFSKNIFFCQTFIFPFLNRLGCSSAKYARQMQNNLSSVNGATKKFPSTQYCRLIRSFSSLLFKMS